MYSRKIAAPCHTFKKLRRTRALPIPYISDFIESHKPCSWITTIHGFLLCIFRTFTPSITLASGYPVSNHCYHLLVDDGFPSSTFKLALPQSSQPSPSFPVQISHQFLTTSWLSRSLRADIGLSLVNKTLSLACSMIAQPHTSASPGTPSGRKPCVLHWTMEVQTRAKRPAALWAPCP
jgi:hypothetical protein